MKWNSSNGCKRSFLDEWFVESRPHSYTLTSIYFHRFVRKPTLAIIKLNVLYTLSWCIWPLSCVMNMEKVAHSRKYDSNFVFSSLFLSLHIFISFRFILLKSSKYNLCCITAHFKRCYFKPLNTLIEIQPILQLFEYTYTICLLFLLHLENNLFRRIYF